MMTELIASDESLISFFFFFLDEADYFHTHSALQQTHEELGIFCAYVNFRCVILTEKAECFIAIRCKIFLDWICCIFCE